MAISSSGGNSASEPLCLHGLTMQPTDGLAGPHGKSDELRESVMRGMIDELATRIPALPLVLLGRPKSAALQSRCKAAALMELSRGAYSIAC